MKQYICIVTNEFADMGNNFIHSMTFHTSYEDADKYGMALCRTLAGETDCYIYRNISIKDEMILNQIK